MLKTKSPILIIAAGLGVALALLLATYFLLPLRDRGPWEVTIATGTEGGTYLTLGQQLARILVRLPEIQEATARETAASVENIQLLCDSKADIAFVFNPALTDLPQEEREKICVLARLYTDVVQIVVRKDAGIQSLTDLNGKKVYVGKKKSGTKVIAEAILKALQIFPSMKVDEGKYEQASQMLINGELDAVFFVSGKRTKAVKMALESGKCYLLDLSDSLVRITESNRDVFVEEIPANFYANQTKPVLTVGADALLMCRKNLNDNLALLILNTLFDNIGDLLIAHARAHDIRFERAFDRLPNNVELHPSAIKFREREQKELLIATGAFNGKYHELGKTMQMLLAQYGISARAVHTEGSIENLSLLTQRPTLAIIQYDVALASYMGNPEFSYGKKESSTAEIAIRKVRNIRRIATLHPEKVHIMIRRDQLPNDIGTRPTVQALRNTHVCTGPANSGTRILAQAILKHHDINLKSPIPLSVPDMLDRINNGEIAAGFFVSHVPSEAVKTILDNEEIRLLSIEPKKMTKLVGSAIRASRIAAVRYGCQLEGEPAVETLETRAVLVTTEDLPFNVQTITEAVFEGAGILGLEKEAMATDLSIPVHPEARKYYKKAGLIPSKPPFDWLAAAWRSLACIVILVTGYRGFLHWGREKTARLSRQRIYDVSVKMGEPHSVERLFKIRRDIRECIRKKWWQGGKLDEARRRNLEKLIAERISDARAALTTELLTEIRTVAKDKELDRKGKLESFTSLEEQIWTHIESGELNESQHAFLMGLIQNQRAALTR